VPAILQAIARTAARLCDASDAHIYRVEGDHLRVLAIHGSVPTVRSVGQTIPVTPRLVTGHAVLDRRTIHLRDITTSAVQQRYPGLKDLPERFRTLLIVPLLRDDHAIGLITIRRTRVRPFTAKQIALLRTFADQAAIALENERLRAALEGRNQELKESLERETATGDVLRIISRSVTDVQPVLEAIVESATRLCDASFGALARFDGQMLVLPVLSRASQEEVEAAQTIFPTPPTRGTSAGRAVLERRVVHIENVLEDPEYTATSVQRTTGYRTALAVPLLRDGEPIGALIMWRREVKPFSQTQIDLMTTFADQAVIAIENVRLFTELEARNHDLTEALEQQTATSEILRVISSSPTDVQPVFDTIAKSSMDLCDAAYSVITRYDGQLLHLVAHAHVAAEGVDVLRRAFPMRPSRATTTSRAILERAVVHVPDVLEDPDYSRSVALGLQNRSTLAIPMLRDGEPIGTISVGRLEPRPFTEKQIDLLKTFADQAVIAIENVRLFTELEARNRDLTDSLERETATSDVLRIISRSMTDVQPVLEAIVDSATRLCEAAFSGMVRFDGRVLTLPVLSKASQEELEAARTVFPTPPTRGVAGGRAVLERRIVHIHDVREDPEYAAPIIRATLGYRTVLAVPLLRSGEPIGALVMWRREVRPFSEKQVDLMKTFADQAVIAIENVRLFTELEARNRDLTEALEQQTATSEILRVISSSPTDVQPVFDTIAESALRLCDGVSATVYRFDGTLIHISAQSSTFTPEGREAFRRRYPAPPSRTSVVAQTILQGDVIHVRDFERDDVTPVSLEMSRAAGHRSLISIPMLREGSPIGAIAVGRRDPRGGPRPFSDREISLLRTFADQAVIAIENVRLFTELEARNREVTEALEQQTATSEILRVISSSPTDVQPVFDTIAERAMRLCGASSGAVLTFDGELVHIAALANVRPEGAAALRSAFPMRPGLGSASTRAVLTGALVHIPDVLAADKDYEIATQAQAGGFRSAASVPMLREGSVIGTVTVGRPQPGGFSERQIALLKTFADQAVIAIENVRLFTELEARNKDLTESLEQQTATSEILKVISSSPTDVQPVFDTIVQSVIRLCDGVFTTVFQFDGELIHAVAHHQSITPEASDLFRSVYPLAPSRDSLVARSILDRTVTHVPDVEDDREVPLASRRLARTVGYRSILGVPMLREGNPIGAIGVGRRASDGKARPFSVREIALLRTFADQAVIAIENVRLFTELEARNRDLTEALEQQTATSEILRVISSSPTDVQPVFDTIVQSAARLCEAERAFIFRFDGQLLRFVAAQNASAELRAFVETNPVPPGRGSGMARAALERRTIHIHDAQTDPEYTYAARRVDPVRSVLAIPMLRAGELLGVIIIYRFEVRPFTDSHIALMETFADQAAIAIENVRLFTELEAKNRDLTEALEQQTATSEILRAISGAQTDAQPVFEAIVRNAVRLCDGFYSVLFSFDGEWIHARALHNVSPAAVEAFAQRYPMRADERRSMVALAITERRVIRIRDMRDGPDVHPESRGGADGEGRPIRGRHRRLPPGGPALLGRGGGPPPDVCRSGGHRHRERAPLPGARGAQPRSHRGPRAADRDRGNSASHLQLANRRPAGLRHDRGERRPTLQRANGGRVSLRRGAGAPSGASQLPARRAGRAPADAPEASAHRSGIRSGDSHGSRRGDRGYAG
jgi:GAF domain-containing protein